jgi:hypothetical protein
LIPSIFTVVGIEVQPSFLPERGPLAVSVTSPRYIFDASVECVDLEAFVLFDRGAQRWLKAQKPLEPLYKNKILDFQPDESRKLFTQKPAGIVVERSLWITGHIYGALVSLDQSDAR